MKIYNKRTDKDIPTDAICVGRPSVFGNPYSHLSNTAAKYKVGTRAEAISKFRDNVNQLPEFREIIKKELKGKSLICWCAPLPCHAEILMEIANSGE